MGTLEGKVALITGAGGMKGIGRATALKLAREGADLVLSDVEMPNMGGLELLAEIRQRTQKLPVVMLTTRGTVEDRQRASALGANAYLLKTGFKSDALLDVVLRFLPPSSHQNRAEKSTDSG